MGHLADENARFQQDEIFHGSLSVSHINRKDEKHMQRKIYAHKQCEWVALSFGMRHK